MTRTWILGLALPDHSCLCATQGPALCPAAGRICLPPSLCLTTVPSTRSGLHWSPELHAPTSATCYRVSLEGVGSRDGRGFPSPYYPENACLHLWQLLPPEEVTGMPSAVPYGTGPGKDASSLCHLHNQCQGQGADPEVGTSGWKNTAHLRAISPEEGGRTPMWSSGLCPLSCVLTACQHARGWCSCYLITSQHYCGGHQAHQVHESLGDTWCSDHSIGRLSSGNSPAHVHCQASSGPGLGGVTV